MAIMLGGDATAQSAASVTITHDHPTGLVQPGESIRLRYTLSWTGAYMFSGIKGDAVATPNVGTASNQAFHPNAWTFTGTVLNLGTPSGGSVMGVHVEAGIPPLHPGGPYTPWRPGPIMILAYDWTAPTTLGEVEFDWLPSAAQPAPLMFFGTSGGSLGPIATTYLGTSLTVVPAPAGGLVVLAGLACCGRRQR